MKFATSFALRKLTVSFALNCVDKPYLFRINLEVKRGTHNRKVPDPRSKQRNH